MRAVTAETTAHLTATRLEHLGQTLAAAARRPRLDLAQMQITTDTAARAPRRHARRAWEPGARTRCCACSRSRRPPARRRSTSTDLAMKVCGGAAFRKELGVERRFRDARAARVMAPTTDALLDFIGRARCGLPLLGDVP